MPHHPPRLRALRVPSRTLQTALSLSIASMLTVARASETWIGSGIANWSESARWLDGSAPPFGGEETLAVFFGPLPSATTTANLDLGLFSLNRLDLEVRAAGSLQIGALAGSALRFAGAGPALSFRGVASATIPAPVTLAGSLSIAGESAGTLSLSGAIGEEGGSRGLSIDVIAPRVDIGAVQLSGANTFSGGVELIGGNLVVNHAAGLGSGALTVRGGSLRLGAITLANDAALHRDLLLAETATATWSGIISSAVADTGLTMRGGGTLTLTGASTYSGQTVLDFSLAPTNTASVTSPRLVLSGDGALLASSAFHIRAGARLTLEASVTGATDRLGDTAAIRLRSGELRFADTTGNALAKTETLGTVSLAGHSKIELAAGISALTLSVAGFERTERGTLLAAGLSPVFTNVKLRSAVSPNLFGGGAASGPATSIVPWAIGEIAGSGASLAGSSFVTFSSANGFRMLDPVADYSTALDAGATRNVRVAATTTLAGPATVNALWLAGGSINGTGQTLTIGSGALASATTGTIAPNLAFGSAEAIITPVSGTLTIAGSISGTNGLTKSGAGRLVLRGTNSISGPLTINAGQIQFDAANQLGSSTTPIVLNATGAGLTYSGIFSLALTRPFALNAGIGIVNSVSGISPSPGELTLAGGTSGEGGWQLGSAGGRIRLTGTANHTGPTILGGGRLWFASDSALGGGDFAVAAGASQAVLVLGGSWSTSRRIALNAPVLLSTNGFDAVLSGPLTGSGQLTKSGPGNLRILSGSGLASSILFDSGRLEIAGAGVVRSPSVTLSSGAALVLDNTDTADSDRFAGSYVVLKNGELRLDGNATTLVQENIFLVDRNNLDGTGRFTITVTGPGSAGTVLSISILSGGPPTLSYPVTNAPTVVRGTQLGGAAGGAFTRLVLTGAGATSGFRSDFVADDMSGLATSFAIYDDTTDAAGTIGFRPIAAAEYRDAANIQNPNNGGATPADAHLLLQGTGSASGANNFAQTLTLGAGSALTLAAGQTLSLSRGAVLARPGGAPATVAGGTIDGGSEPLSVYLAGDLRFGANATSGTGRLDMQGPGALDLQSGAHLPAVVTANGGVLRARDAAALADSLVSLAPLATLELAAPTTVGGLAGTGQIALGSNTLTVGTLPSDFIFSGTITGAGGVRIVDGGRPGARRQLPVQSTFAGGITLDSGVLVALGDAAFGPGVFTANGGALEGSSTGMTLANPIVLNGTLDLRTPLTLGPGASVSGSGGFLASTGSLTVTGLVDFPGTVTSNHRGTFATPQPATKITISGASGSLRARGGLEVNPGTILFADLRTPYTGADGGRLADDGPVSLRSGILEIYNESGSVDAVSEKFGTLRVAGFSRVRMTPTASGSISLEAASLERIDRGTFEILSGRTLGAAGAGAGFIRFAAAPPTSAGGVLPYAVATLSGSSNYGVVVNDAVNGLRLLTNGEYTTTIAAATPASHLVLPLVGDPINAGPLTVRTLRVFGDGAKGGGAITVAGGLVLSGGGGIVDNPIRFGASEGFIATPDGGRIDFLKPVSGSGGLTLFGRGLVTFSGGNQVGGQLVLNGSVRLSMTGPNPFGPDPLPILLNEASVGAGFDLESGAATIDRAIQVNGSYLALRTYSTDAQLTLAGPISGSGGVYISRFNQFGIPTAGFSVLAGVNSYSGPTVVENGLAFSSDAALGNSSSLILGGGTIKLLGDWITTRRAEVFDATSNFRALTLDTNGFNATFRGVLQRMGPYASSIVKRGSGTFAIATPQDGGEIFTVESGQLVFTESGRAQGATVEVRRGASFVIDNRMQPADRGSNTVYLAGGELTVLGHATAPTSYAATINGTSGYGVVTLSAPGTASVTLNAAVFTNGEAFVLLRGDQLGSGPARILFRNPPLITNGLLPHVIADTASTGGGSSFATYDATSDARGTIGVRPLLAAEYATGADLRNPANGGGIPPVSNFLASGAVSVTGPANILNTLTLDPGAQLGLGVGQTLTLTQSALLVREGAPATIAGGTLLRGANSTLSVFGGGHLQLGATVPAGNWLRMFGPGVLEVVAPQPGTTFTLSGGSVRPGAGDPFVNTKIQLDGGRLDLHGISTRIPELNGTGTVEPGGATLSVTGNFPALASSFAGAIVGTGTFESAGSAGLTLTGASPFTGTLAVKGGRLTVSGTLPAIGAISIRQGILTIDNRSANDSTPRLGTAPVSMSGSTLQLLSGYDADTVATFEKLRGEGHNSIFVQPSSSGVPRETRLTFADLAREDRGTFTFATGFGQTPARFDFTADLSSLLVGNPAVAPQRPVLPFATIDNHAATFQVGVGLRVLRQTEKSILISAGANVDLIADTNLDRAVTINSLDLDSRWVTGNGILRIASGLIAGRGRIISTVDFGTAEGVIINFDGGNGATELVGPIRGSNGLTISTGLYNGARLTGNNTFTGRLTVNAGLVTFTSAAALGLDPSPIVLRAGGLVYAGTTPLTLTRALDLQGGTASLGRDANSPSFTVAGQITGSGDLSLGNVTLTNSTNSYSGVTTIAGTVRFPSDAVFGQSPVLSFLSNGILAPSGDWSTNRTLLGYGYTGTIDTGAFRTTLAGPLLGSAPLIKTGAGRLTIGDGGGFTGELLVSAGALRLHGPLGGTPFITVAAGARLEGDSVFSRTVISSGTIAPGAGAGILESGNLVLRGGSALELDLPGPSEFDQLRVNGLVTFDGLVQLGLNFAGAAFGANTDLPILLNDGTDRIVITATKSFAIGGNVLEEGERFTVGSQNVRITYAGGDGNDIVLTVPEPSTAATLLAGLGTLLVPRRRRRT